MYLQWLVFEEHSKQGTSHCCQLWRQKDFMESDLILRWLEPLGQQKTEIIVMAFMIPCPSFPEYQIQHIPPFETLALGHSVLSCKLLCHHVVQYHIWTCECIHQRWWSHCIPCWGVTEVPIHLRAAQEDFNVIVLKGLFHQIASNKWWMHKA